jgi:SAM-dependent methyltransferase
MTDVSALAIYAAHAGALARRYDSVTTDAVLAGMDDLIPSPPAKVLDVGAGSGRDTQWFLERGYAVTAAEPVAAFCALIMARAPAATLVDAGLPDLDGLSGRFELILVNAVWHHLSPAERDTAILRLAGLLVPDGRVFIALRQGPVGPDASLHLLDPDAETTRAASAGLSLIRRHDAPAHDPETAAAGISWTWLAFAKDFAR